MRIELLPGTLNVIRFPTKRRARPTLDLLRQIAPDAREALNLADAFGIEPPPHDLRDRTDAEAASYIALQVPADGRARAAMLADIESQVAGQAIEGARAAHDARLGADAAHRAVESARRDGGPFWVDGLQQKADTLTERAVVLVLQAYALAEEAEGVARAVKFARRREAWAPRDHDAETDALIALGTAVG